MDAHHQSPDGSTATPAGFRVAIVDDDDAVRAALKAVFAKVRNMTVVAALPDGESALRELPRCAPDVVLMDIKLPGISGIECVSALKSALPEVRVVMLTGQSDEESVFQSIMAGADGYLLKPSSCAEVLQATREILAGGAPISAPIARRVLDYFHTGQTGAMRPARLNAVLELQSLSAREHEVLSKLAGGMSVKAVAGALNITWETVRHHISNIYDKLHVHSRTEAILKFLGHPSSGPG